MIKVCVADNYPVVHFGIKSFFKDHTAISIVANVGNFSMVKDILYNKTIDVLVIDLDLEGLTSLHELKAVIKNYWFSSIKEIFVFIFVLPNPKFRNPKF